MNENCKNCGQEVNENNPAMICPICGKVEFCENCGCHCSECEIITCEKCNHEQDDDYLCSNCMDQEDMKFNKNIDKQIRELKKTIKFLESLKK